MRSSLDGHDCGLQASTGARSVTRGALPRDLAGDDPSYKARLEASFVAMHRLHDLQAMLASETDLSTALTAIVSAATEFCGTDRGCIQVVSADGARLEMFVHRGYEPDSPFIDHLRYNGFEPACDASRAGRTRVVIDDVAALPALMETEGRRLALAEGIGAIHATPMINRKGDLVGVLYVQFRHPHRSSDDVLKLVDILAWTAADFLTRNRMEVALRQATEEKMRSREEELRVALKAGRFGAWSLDLRTNELTTSDCCRTNFGRPADAPFSYDDLLAAVHPHDQRRMRDAVERSIVTGGDYEIEYRIVTPEGETRWVQIRGQARYDAAGAPVLMSGVSIDITERRRAEAELYETSERLRLATDHSEVGFWDVDRVNDQLIWPPRTKAMFGMAADAPVTMQDFYDGLHPDDREATSEAYAAAADPDRRALYDVEYRTLGKDDGLVRWVAAKGRGVFDDAGRCLRVAGTAIDITARKAVEARLRASEELNRRVLASSPDCIKVLDLDARVEFMSAGGMGIMEIDSFEAVRGTYWPDFWQGEEHAKALAAVEKAKRCGSGRFQGFALTMKGSPRWWDVAVTPINDPDGRPEKLLSVSRDITEQRRAEERLRELNETLEAKVAERTIELRRFRDIVEATTSPICAFDTAYRLVAFNKAHNDEFKRVNGFETKVGDVFPDLFIAEQQPVMRALMDRALDGESFTVEAQFGRPEFGQPSWEIQYTPLRDEDHRLIGAFHLATDMSEKMRAAADLAAAQEALRQSQKMESMGQLTGGVAHDFNNLLTPIIGSLDMLVRKGVGSERERRLIDGALQSAERAKTLVQRLLAFARRQPLQPVAVDVRRLVDGMAGLISSTLGPTIGIRVDLAPDLPAAKADPNQLEMALLNLAVNARDAMPEGGELVIAARCEIARGDHASPIRPGRYVRLSVSDTGVGMDEGTLARAIEPFFSTKGVGKGTGLGLSMVHGLAAQLGGGLTIDSVQGRGTSIDLWLPISATGVGIGDANDDAPAPPARFGRGIALLVDDEELVRMSTADMLTDLGFEVVEAGSANEALQHIRRGVMPDLLVTDHLMPGMTGADLARAARHLKPALPVLIVSGYAETEGIAPELPRLIKPFRNAELAASVATLIPAAGA